MIFTIPELVPQTAAERIVAEIAGLNWHPGDSPDSEYAERVKLNEELKEKDHPLAEQHLIAIMRAMMTNPEFRNFTYPFKVKSPQFNKYTGGGTYNRHSDSTLMGSPPIRTDISVTVFLSDPNDYDGGELTLEYPTGEVKQVKEARGTLVCYPSDVMHYVTPVTRGTRYAAITWVQSHIRSAAQRTLLTELSNLSRRIKQSDGISDNYTSLFSIHNNLFRMWCEF